MLLPAGHTVSRHLHSTIAPKCPPLPSRPFIQHQPSPSNHHQHMPPHVTITSTSRSIKILSAAIYCARSSLRLPVAGQILYLPCLHLLCRVKTLAFLHLLICRVKTLALQRWRSQACCVQNSWDLKSLGANILFTKRRRLSLTMDVFLKVPMLHMYACKLWTVKSCAKPWLAHLGRRILPNSLMGLCETRAGTI